MDCSDGPEVSELPTWELPPRTIEGDEYMDDLLQDLSTGFDRGVARPFRQDADELIAMFQTRDAGMPEWHRARARTLLRDAQLQTLSPVTDAWRRIASRHISTALLLEEQLNAAPPDPVGRNRRFFRL
jgi:hypothetical protein